ncbi:MAG: RNA polymerase sigma factor [Planctomycetales bacterium]|nr:RNA polymerase sigma factor [Planctomycetales bacterium]
MGAILKSHTLSLLRPAESASLDLSRVEKSSAIQQGEARLLARAQRGDRPALAAIIEAHQHDVYAYLAARLLEPADAADLCQEVFLRCLQGKVGQLRQVRLRVWLIGVARNVLREHIRRIDTRREIAWSELCLELETMSPEPDPLYDDMIDHLPQCLDELGPSARRALDMHYRDRHRIAAISDKLKRSEGAVRLLMHRARQAVRRCLERKSSGQGETALSA